VVSLSIEIFLGNTKVNEVDLIFELPVFLKIPNHYIVWLDITVDIALLVKALEESEELYAQIDNTDEGEVMVVFLQDVFDAHA